ncbi:hypothetical protein [Marinisporobacter balticus]|uniref:Uncharacterized protein n=1 Tax=Marinisporobacter balticus TaxID=2018667 RepID=A0A4R2KF50_9FIRM|nr:hypothetical protein [Marinisporobacter balticus]TCO68976.1 hypothetical protein EV214_1362 [Marinisporobacter balticus]
MEGKKTYAEEIIKKIKESKSEDSKNIYNIENDIQDGFVIVKYKKLEVEERELLDGDILMFMPTEFEIMDEELAEIKYPGEDKPDYIYTNEDTTVNLTFSIEEGEINNEEIEEVRDILAKQMQKLYPASKIEDSETLQLDEKSISYFSFDVPLLDGDLYNFMFFMEIKGELLMGTFNSSVYQKKEWKPILKQMLMTIKENKEAPEEESNENR